MAVARNQRANSIRTVIRRAKASQGLAREPVTKRGRPIRVAIADDSYLIREALGEVLAPAESLELVATAADGDALLAAVESERPVCRRPATTRASLSPAACARRIPRSA